MIGIDAKSSQVLQATLLSIHVAPKAIQQNIKRYTSTELRPLWREELEKQPHTEMQQKLLIDSSQVTTTNTEVNLRSGGISEALSGGLSTDYQNPLSRGGNRYSYKGFAFGANRQSQRKYKATSKSGKKFTVVRHTARQFPAVGQYVVVPAAVAFIPRAGALWVATIVRTLYDAFEGKLR